MTALTLTVYAAFLALLVVAAVIDLRTLRIPDALIVLLFAIWAGWRLVVHFFLILTAPVTFSQGVVGAIVLGGGLLVLTALYEMVTHKRAMGGGDIKLFAVIGLYLGIGGGLICLMFSCVAAVLLAFILPRAGWRPPADEVRAATSNDVDGDGVPDHAVLPVLKDIPFGPAIAVGAVATVLVAVL